MRIGGQRNRDRLAKRSSAALPVPVPKVDSAEALDAVLREEIKHAPIGRIRVLRVNRQDVHAIIECVTYKPVFTEVVPFAWCDGVHMVILPVNLDRSLSRIFDTFLRLIPPLFGTHALPVEVL